MPESEICTVTNQADMYRRSASTRGTWHRTRKGGWFLMIAESGLFHLGRYQHSILRGNVDHKVITGAYAEMLQTDLSGANKFLQHFTFPGRVTSARPNIYALTLTAREVRQ